ncbi:MAG TPA: DUF488 domain-containing protein [Candidatus Dormibacteraeota bacterium]
MTVLTVGHSTRSLAELVGLLTSNRVEELWDVRTVPGSRRMPHFSAASLAVELPRHGIAYRHLKALGGLRRPRPDSPNTAWRNQAFRGYADHMQTPEFAPALAELVAAQEGRRLAVMCAEAVPWRCHRSLLADALLARGVEVLDIIDEHPPKPHRMTPFAVVDGGRVIYPGTDTLRFDG